MPDPVYTDLGGMNFMPERGFLEIMKEATESPLPFAQTESRLSVSVCNTCAAIVPTGSKDTHTQFHRIWHT